MGKLHFAFPCAVNRVIHDGIASYAHFHDAVFPNLLLFAMPHIIVLLVFDEGMDRFWNICLVLR